MIILAWIYLVSCVLFFVGLILAVREPDKAEKQATLYPKMFGLLFLFVFSGLGLALGALNVFPTVIW